MCCFSRPVKHVSSTSIFARMMAPGRQVLAYSMTLEASEPLAMILPLPTPPGGGEDAVRFIDLSGYDRLFVDLQSAFSVEYLAAARSGGLFQQSRQPRLAVHDVGQFEASFVPSQADFSRLDPRFRLDDRVWQGLPRYADYGFAVFQLRGFERGWWQRLLGRAAPSRSFHPMAFSFATREPRKLFFPTVHVHDGEARPVAHFDHWLYAQCDAAPGSLLDDRGEAEAQRWDEGGPAARVARTSLSGDVVATRGDLFRRTLMGDLNNGDRWATLPAEAA